MGPVKIGKEKIAESQQHLEWLFLYEGNVAALLTSPKMRHQHLYT